MNIDGSIERVMDAASTHVRAIHVAVNVEVDGVATDAERLSSVRDLDMFYVADDFACVQLLLVEHDLRPELVAADLVPETTLEARVRRELA